MVRVDLQTFLTSGELGPVVLGMSRAALRAALGPPGDDGGTSRRQRNPTIWRYGDLEFHFAGDTLALVFLERFSGPGAVPTGGNSVDLDPWFIRLDTPFQTVADALK